MSKRFATGLLLLLVTALSIGLTACGGPTLIDRAENPLAYGFCGLVILILDIIAIVEILNSPWTVGRKLIWILLIIFLPILGLILYFVFARGS